jgi:hypothetical protein
MNRTLVLTTIAITSLLLIFVSLHNFGVIYSGLLARILAEPTICSREFESICYSEQYFEGNLSQGQLIVGGQKLDLSDLGNSNFQVGQLQTQVFIPSQTNTEEGIFYFGLDFNSFIEQSQSEDMCIKGRFLNIYKHSDVSGVAMPYGAGDNVLELSLCNTSSYPPSVFSENLLNGTN